MLNLLMRVFAPGITEENTQHFVTTWWFTLEMASHEKQVQIFHTDDVPPPRSGY